MASAVKAPLLDPAGKVAKQVTLDGEVFAADVKTQLAALYFRFYGETVDVDGAEVALLNSFFADAYDRRGGNVTEAWTLTVAAVLQEGGVPGASFAVAVKGKLVYVRGFGYADLERRLAVRPDSLFRVASVSKPFSRSSRPSLASPRSPQQRARTHR